MSQATRIAITGGRLIDPHNNIDDGLDLFIDNGHICGIDTAPAGFTPDREIDAAGLWVIPGLIELGANLPDDQPEALARHSHAAAAGGITTLCLSPDMNPCLDGPASIELVHARAQRHGSARLVTLGGLTRELAGQQLCELGALKEAGCVGVSNGRRPVTDTRIMRRAMEYAASHELTVFVHARDPWLYEGGCIHEGELSTRLGLPGIPAAAEAIGVARELALAELTGTQIHFCRLSTAESVDMIRRARSSGLSVSADVAIHHLLLSDSDVHSFDSRYRLDPPLRTAADREALLEGLTDGTISAVCSDHRPVSRDGREQPFPAADAGIDGLHTLLALMLGLVHDGQLTPADAVRLLSSAPAQLLGLAQGRLAAGQPADLCVLDPMQGWTPAGEPDSHHCPLASPFFNTPLRGRVIHTFVGGQQVYSQT